MKYPKALDAWWSALTLKGDPLRRPNLAFEAFDAGYEAGARAILMTLGEHAKVGNKWAIPLEDRND